MASLPGITGFSTGPEWEDGFNTPPVFDGEDSRYVSEDDMVTEWMPESILIAWIEHEVNRWENWLDAGYGE